MKILVQNKAIRLSLGPPNYFRATFLMKGPPNILKYYQSNIRKSEKLKIRHRLIDQATAKLKSGSWLIYQAPV